MSSSKKTKIHLIISSSSHILVFTVISRFCKSSHTHFFAVKQNFKEQISYTELTLNSSSHIFFKNERIRLKNCR
ncbi:hypothetical protein [Leptospira noguchii]|uniref:hypothetical protein n=1 Tax=Leptospira noguchii TaxID=28182 RepID=UPI0009E55F0A|nr:hypothetical protein [Leptospira noguchii]